MSRRERGERAVLRLVPTDGHVERALEVREAAGSFDERVSTSGRFAAEVIAGALPERAIASREEALLATRIGLERAAEEAGADDAEAGGPLDAVDAADAGDPGAARALAAAALEWAMRDRGAFGIAAAPDERRQRAWLHRRRALEAAGLVDARDAKALLAERGEFALPVPLGAIRVEATARFGADDLAWLAALHRASRAAGGAGVVLELPEDPRVREEVAPIAAAIEEAWAPLEDAPEIAFAPLERAASARGPRVVLAADAQVEARAAVAAILRAADRGARLERSCIVAPPGDAALAFALRAELSDAGIPFAAGRAGRISATPEGRALGAIVSLAAGPLTRDALLELLASDCVAWQAYFPGGAEPARLAARELARRLRGLPLTVDRGGGRFPAALREALRTEGARLAALPGGPALGSSSAAVIATDRAAHGARLVAGLEALLDDADAIGRARTRLDVSRRVRAWLARVALGRADTHALARAIERPTRGAARLSGQGAAAGLGALAAHARGQALDALGASTRAARAIDECLGRWAAAQARLAIEGAASSAAELAAELELTVDAGARGAASRSAALRVVGPTEACGLAHDALVVVGVARGYAGARVDDDIARRASHALLGARRAAQHAELAWAIALAADATVVASGAAEARHPPLVERLLRDGAPPYREPASRVARGASTTTARAAGLARLHAGDLAPPSIAAQVRVERARAAFFEDRAHPGSRETGVVLGAAAEARGDGADGAVRERLGAALGGLEPSRAIAVTLVERSIECAFASFARRVLRANAALDDAEEAIDPRERGDLVHAALQNAFEALRDAPPSEAPRARFDRAAAAAADRLGVAAAATAIRRELLTRALDETLRTVVATDPDLDAVAQAALAAAEAGAAVAGASEAAAGPPASCGLRFWRAEQQFGGRGAGPDAWPALELPGPPGEPSYYVEGRIDRVDLSPDGRAARVIDYKTGTPPSAKSQGVTSLQLPLYAEVVRHRLGAATVDAAYVRSGLPGDAAFSPKAPAARERIAALAPEAAAAAREAIRRLHAGDFRPQPREAAACARCDVRDLCRRPAVVMDAGDPSAGEGGGA